MRRYARWRRAAGILLVGAAVFYLARTIADHWQELQGFEWRVRPGLLGASIASHVLVLGWGVWVWSRVLRHFDYPAPVGLVTLLRIWFLSNLARYVPGKVFQFMAAAQLSQAAGLSARVVLTSMLVHAGLALLAALVVAAWTLTGGLLRGINPLWPALAVSIAAVATVHPATLNRIIGTFHRLLRREVTRWTGRWIDGVGLLVLSIVSWLFYGGAYQLFLAALADVPWALLPQMAGVNALSFFVGYVSVLPGGIGLREAAMSELLRAYLAPGVGAVLAIASRLWTIGAELIGGALALAASHHARLTASAPAPPTEK